MATNGDGGVAVATSHQSAWKNAGLKTKQSSDLPVGCPSPSRTKRKREAEESAAEESDGAAAEEELGKEQGLSKKEKKKNKKKRKERDAEGGGNEVEPKKERKEKKDKKIKRNKDKKQTSSSSEGDVRPEKDTPPPTSAAPPSPPDSNSTIATILPNAGSPSKSSLKNLAVKEKHLLRKSVSFTADTKATDGDSIKTMYQNHDPFAHYESYQQHINNYPTNELPEGFDDEPALKAEFKGKHKKFDDEEPTPTQVPDKKKQKKERKNRKGEDIEDDASGVEASAKLSYLLAFHTTRDTWKFEKAKQNWILRHAFDSSRIPENGYADALKSYIAGLQSQPARDRLLAEANEIVKRGKDTISKDGEKLDLQDQKINVTRAKLVLSALGHKDDDDDDEEAEEEAESSSDEEE